jgi:gamma-tubulin complex component 3
MSLSAPTPDAADSTNESKPAEGGGLTLMRLGLWTEDMRLKMKMMSMVVDDAKGGLTLRRFGYEPRKRS